jgi:ABC-type multidrug transport system fused ATPase/permease subunit
MGLSLRYHGSRRLGDLLSRVSSDVTNVTGEHQRGSEGLVLEPLIGLGALVGRFVIARSRRSCSRVPAASRCGRSRASSRRVRKGSKKSLASLGDSVQSLTQMFQGVRTVKAFGGEEREIERYRALNQTYLASTDAHGARDRARSRLGPSFYSRPGSG